MHLMFQYAMLLKGSAKKKAPGFKNFVPACSCFYKRSNPALQT